jgi:uncharacterized membrane protein YkgB
MRLGHRHLPDRKGSSEFNCRSEPSEQRTVLPDFGWSSFYSLPAGKRSAYMDDATGFRGLPRNVMDVWRLRLGKTASSFPPGINPNLQARTKLRPRSDNVPADGTVLAFPPRAATSTELANKEQGDMATDNYTDDAALITEVEQEHTTLHERSSLSFRVEAVGLELARYGLVVVLAWIGLMKFTAYEAEGISPFVANSPLMSWVYGIMSVRGFSAALGVVEVAIAILVAARPFSPRSSALGSALAVGMFLTTLSFLVTTPGVWEASVGGFPALSALPGQFLIKDLALLGISLWSLGESWKASMRAAA